MCKDLEGDAQQTSCAELVRLMAEFAVHRQSPSPSAMEILSEKNA